MSSNSKDTDFAPINVDVSDRIPLGSNKAPPKRPKGSGGSGGSGGKTLFILALIVAIGASAGCAYLYVELQKSQETISANQNRLQSLENKLSATGEEMGNSTVALQVKVTELSAKSVELWDQMDKLWASAWRRNQEEIKTLNSDLSVLKSSVNTSVDEVTKKVNATQSGTQQLMTRIDSLNSKMTEQANNLLAVKVEYEGFSDANSSQNSEIRELEEKILLLEKRNISLLQKLNEVEGQVRELAVKTI
jgi:chromosome segregation ATPase